MSDGWLLYEQPDLLDCQGNSQGCPGICRMDFWALYSFLLLQERGEVLINRGSVNRYKVISRIEGQYGG